MTTLSFEETLQFRALKRTGWLLMLLMRLDRPTGETEIAEFEKRFATAGLVITQPILEERFGFARTPVIKKHLTNQKLLVITNLFFTGYFPTVIHWKGITAKENFHIEQCGLVLALYKAGFSREEAERTYHRYAELDFSQMVSQAEKSLEIIKTREKNHGVNLPVSSFLAENYRRVKSLILRFTSR